MTTWRGVTLDARSAAMMDEVAMMCTGIPIDPTQGSYSGGVEASAGTHSGGGAIDLAAERLTGAQRDDLVLAMRMVGWAAWLRTPAQSDWPFHIHGVAVACIDLAPAARDQVDDYLAGRNGLASGAPDDGPRGFDHVGITWEEYQGRDVEDGPGDEEEDDMEMVVRKANGAAYLLIGANVAVGIYSGTAIGAYEAGGVPVVDLPDKDWDAALKGREKRTV